MQAQIHDIDCFPWIHGTFNLLHLVTFDRYTILFQIESFEFMQVLMYGSASIAVEICHINRWDNCSLPINALETALELRQLDTLAFFLRSREGGKQV